MRRFYFRLAAEVFHCSVAEMLDRITSSELSEWLAYYRLQVEPQAQAQEPVPSAAQIRDRFDSMRKVLGRKRR